MNTQNKIFLNYDKRMNGSLYTSPDFEQKNEFFKNLFFENYMPFCPPRMDI